MGKGEAALLMVFVCAAFFVGGGWSQSENQLVPAIITFGDSTVDIGNNNKLFTTFKANYPPYGRDFQNRQATGRFCNGKLATDITADTLGFSKYPPAYLTPEASGKNLLIGANFASAGSGYDDKTAALSNVIPLSQQLRYFREYKRKLAKVAGRNASNIISGAIYIVSTGSSDFIQNYYVNPLINKLYSPEEYSSYLVGIFSSFIKDLYKLGARKIGVTNLPPLGCIPATITLFGFGSNKCVSRINADSQGFNRQLNASAASLSKQYHNLTMVVFDTYQPLLDLVQNPSKFGFAEARRGCCGTGLVETTVLLCNRKSFGTCRNATEYVFFDSVHPSEAANDVLANSLITDGFALL